MREKIIHKTVLALTVMLVLTITLLIGSMVLDREGLYQEEEVIAIANGEVYTQDKEGKTHKFYTATDLEIGDIIRRDVIEGIKRN